VFIVLAPIDEHFSLAHGLDMFERDTIRDVRVPDVEPTSATNLSSDRKSPLCSEAT